MKKLFLTVALLLSITMLMAPVASAQTTISDGCANITGGVLPLDIIQTFAVDEVITIVVAGTGTFDITIAGALQLDAGASGDTVEYTVQTEDPITISVVVTGGTGTATIDCTDVVEEESDGTICHIPPGNPDAAHTITVGSENAVDAHVRNHGDTLGPCPEGTQTRTDFPDISITIFIIFATDSIQVYGDCIDECQEVLNTPIVLVIDFDLVVITVADSDDDDDDDPDQEFVDVENPEDYGFQLDDADVDGLYVVIYYLHPDPENPEVGVFQINVYEDGVLLSDALLVFITVDGDILQFTGQDYWDEQLEESLEADES